MSACSARDASSAVRVLAMALRTASLLPASLSAPPPSIWMRPRAWASSMESRVEVRLQRGELLSSVCWWSCDGGQTQGRTFLRLTHMLCTMELHPIPQLQHAAGRWRSAAVLLGTSSGVTT